MVHTVHEIRVGSIDMLAKCAQCADRLHYHEELDCFSHVPRPGNLPPRDHMPEVEFEVPDPERRDGTFSVGDGFVIVTAEGSWLGECYDISSRGWTAQVSAW